MELIGRETETAMLDGLLARARGGAGAGLVVWGEPGIGKTALLEYAVDAASRSCAAAVLRCRGTPTESRLAFAALHELLWPVAECLETLPAPQAAALRGALGLGEQTAGRFLIGAAVLSLASELARERPLLVVVDDSQWIDEATAHCLGFLARRVAVAPVLVLLTGHEDPATGPWEGLPALEVGGLDDDDARRLVTAVAPDAARASVDDAVHAAGGNPLALHELPTLGREPGDRTAPGPRLRRAFRARVSALAPPTRALLLLAAAEGRGDRDVVDRAGAGWDVDRSSWDEALRSGLLRADGPRVEFRHPLVTAALYDGAALPDRRAAHRALAGALPADAVAERAWHLAAAADGADEEVAALLERAAEQCLQRSAGPTAARTWRRAAELSPAPADAARRLAAAARAAWGAGRAGSARELLDDAERLGGQAPVARAAGGLSGLLEFANGLAERAHHHLTRDMTVIEEPRAVVELGTLAVRTAWSAGRTDLQQEALRRLLAVDAGGDPRLSEVMPSLRGWWSCYDRPEEAAAAAPARTGEVVARLGAVPWELLPPVPLVQAWGVEGPLLDVLRMQALSLRRRHELASLAVVLAQTAALDFASGRWDRAETAAAEGRWLAEEVGADHVASNCRTTLAALAAARGDGRAVDEHTTSCLGVSVPRGVRALSAVAYWFRGRAALFAGRPQEALHHLTALGEPGHEAAHPTIALLAAADTAEAAVPAGRPEVAGSRLAVLDTWAQQTGATWARTTAHRVHALLGDGPAVEASYRAALAVPGATEQPFEYARTRLLYGEWLRRARRRADARHQLAAAAEVLDRLGAAPLRARAQREHDLADGPGARRTAAAATAATAATAGAGLTAQELQVARLAADRLTNREIGAQLLISPRTVGHHLGNVYPKLGITSRGELARVDLDGDLRLRVG